MNKDKFAVLMAVITADIINKIIEKVPNIGIEINNNGVLQCVKYSPHSYAHVMYEFGEFVQYAMNDIPKDSNWLKVLFTGNPEEIDVLMELCNELIAPDASYYVVRSEKTYLELLPKEANKGRGLLRLADMLQVPVKNMYAIGDYYNDIGMFRAAGLGVAVSNACKAAIEAADYVTVSNEEHAIAKIICEIGKEIRI